MLSYEIRHYTEPEIVLSIVTAIYNINILFTDYSFSKQQHDLVGEAVKTLLMFLSM